jgi:peroxisomal 3,2-trans-enoyl-CoA isomerase
MLVANAMAEMLSQLTETIVKSRKPIFAVVEGKTIGFGFTQLALYDRVFAVENSYFMAPLVRTAQGPEMASSYLFPKIFGYVLAQ